MYKVKERFRDSETQLLYEVGETYPKNGKVAEARLKVLSGENPFNRAFIYEEPTTDDAVEESTEVSDAPAKKATTKKATTRKAKK